jgi:hypothetical protein
MEDNTQNADEVSCPFCAESIKVNAKKCKHCKEIIDSQMRELSFLRNNQSPSQIIVNSAASASATLPALQKIHYQHFFHFILSVITCGFWIPIWFLCWFGRDRNVYI